MIIYKTTNSINGKIYIGQSFKNKPSYFGSGNIIKKAIKKYGKQNFKKEIICFCESKEEMDKQEVFWINYYNSTNSKIGYNILKGGNGLTEIARKKSSLSHKGQIPINKGKKLSDKEKNFISERTKQSMSRPEIKEKMKNRKYTEEWKANISKSCKGRKSWCKNKTGVYSKEQLSNISNGTKQAMSRPEIKEKILGKNNSQWIEIDEKIILELVENINSSRGTQKEQFIKIINKYKLPISLGGIRRKYLLFIRERNIRG
jgi:group I intron endonuclease